MSSRPTWSPEPGQPEMHSDRKEARPQTQALPFFILPTGAFTLMVPPEPRGSVEEWESLLKMHSHFGWHDEGS